MSEPSIHTIKQAVSAFYGVPVLDMVSARRDRKTVTARHVAIFWARSMTTHSLPAIGRHFGGRDHTTLIHAIAKIEAMTGGSPEFSRQVSDAGEAVLRAHAAILEAAHG